MIQFLFCTPWTSLKVHSVLLSDLSYKRKCVPCLSELEQTFYEVTLLIKYLWDTMWRSLIFFIFLLMFFFFNFFFNVYLFLGQRETEHERGRGRERGRHRIQSSLQAPSCQHRMRHRGLNSWTTRSWPEPKSDAQPTEPPRHPNIFESQRQSANRGGAERERERQNQKQAPGSELAAQSPTRGLNSQTVRSWPEPKSDAQPTEPPRHPNIMLL